MGRFRYGDHSCGFYWLIDKRRVWQVSFYRWNVHIATQFFPGSLSSGGDGLGAIISCLLLKNQPARGDFANNLRKRCILSRPCAIVIT